MTNLPFDPESVTIQDLAEHLEEVSDEETVHALQRADTRKGAAAVYERRVDELRESQDSEDAVEPSQPATTVSDEERGYRITEWAGHTNYECLDCPLKDLDESKVIRHRVAQHTRR